MNEQMQSRIYVLGSLNMDLVIHSPRVPEAGETLHGSGFLTNPGGKGANQAAACGRLGGDVRMLGRVGADAFGKALGEALERCGVDVSSVREDASQSTGIAVIVVTQAENRIILDAGANAALSPAQAEAFLGDARKGDLFLAQLETPIDTVKHALSIAKARGMRTLINPAPAGKEILPALEDVDILLPNETELALLSGTQDIAQGVLALEAQGVGRVVVTLGSRGCAYRQNGRLAELPAFRVRAVDTTAAGDTFCGALAVRLCAGDALEDALRYASAAAAIAVTRPGAQQSIPDAREVEAFLALHFELI